jgi:hypothetical protein
MEKCLRGKNTSNSHIIQPMTNNLSNMQASMAFIGINNIMDDKSERV